MSKQSSILITSKLSEVTNNYHRLLTNPWLLVDSETQTLALIREGAIDCQYGISTSKYGLGCEQDSFKTPIGAHLIAKKIGSQCQLNEILNAREATGECAEIISKAEESSQDLVLTRVLWLRGLEPDKNLGEGVDSFDRYIYIHGTQEEGLIGTPASHGCIRMLNKDVIRLYDIVEENTFVCIV